MNRQDARSEDNRQSRGFPPIACEDARVLVLGSLPSEASLRAREYYAHPRNAFWKIMQVVAGATGDYASRCLTLEQRGIAVWDVLKSSIRPGSLDADIDMASAVTNDFAAFFARHNRVRLVCFNGRKAEDMFRRFVRPGLPLELPRFELLPSTSPAHASLTVADKIDAWRGIIEPQLGQGQES